MLGLKDKCIHPTTKKTYVKSYGGGRDNSPEGQQVVAIPLLDGRSAKLTRKQGGFTHGFVSEFGSDEDRKYYLEKDPAHLDFVASLKDIVQNVRVLDFQPGVF